MSSSASPHDSTPDESASWLGRYRHLAYPLLAASIPLAVLWFWWAAPNPPVVAAQGLTVLDPPLALVSLELQREEGPLHLPADLREQWTLLAIGFASCPDICPTTLATLAAGVEQAEPSSVPTRVLFISVDPDRDGLPELRAYAAHFGSFVSGATGPDLQLERLTGPTGLFYERRAPKDETGDYDVEHSTAVLILNPQAEVIGVLGGHTRDPQSVAAALDTLRRSPS